MKHVMLLASISLGLLLWPSCKSSTPTQYTPETFIKGQLLFGTGGGFAGTVTTYYLLENGQFFHQPTFNGEITERNTLTKEAAKAFFARAEEIGLASRKLNMPGNMYAFLEWRTPESSNRLVWDPAADKVNAEVKALHDDLMKLAAPVR